MHTESEHVVKTHTKPAILFKQIGVKYRANRDKSGLKEVAISWIRGKLAFRDFWALQDVSFSIMPGEAFGVVGRNGAGKSTMLKVMARVLSPTTGGIIMRGRVAPLLELGGGFHPELTGYENAHINGALLGYSRSEMKKLIHDIVEFSELEDFINVPIRTYSSGMIARLGFAVATCKRPDILLVDEVLSVGDAGFQQKCLKRMAEFKKQGTTIILVSHSLITIQSFCESILWIDSGKIKMLGSVDDVSLAYAKYTHDDFLQKTAGPDVSGTSENTLFLDVSTDHPYYDYIVKAFVNTKMTGFSDGTFRPEEIVNRQQMAVIVFRLRKNVDKLPLVISEPRFKDVPPTHPFATWIEAAAMEKLVLSRDGGNFWPEQSVTRAQAAKLSLKALFGDSFSPAASKGIFTDALKEMANTSWVEEAARLHLLDPLEPENARFGVDEPFTRGEAAKLLCVSLELTIK